MNTKLLSSSSDNIIIYKMARTTYTYTHIDIKEVFV